MSKKDFDFESHSSYLRSSSPPADRKTADKTAEDSTSGRDHNRISTSRSNSPHDPASAWPLIALGHSLLHKEERIRLYPAFFLIGLITNGCQTLPILSLDL